MTRPNRAFCANARPCSASRCTSASGSPAARRFVIRWLQLVRRKGEVADLVRRLERAPHQIAAGPDMSRPGHDDDFRSSDRSGPGSASARAVRPGHSRAGRSEIRPGSRRNAARRACQARHRRSTMPSLLPCSRLRLTIRQMTRESRFASVNKAGGTSLVRTSRVASDAGSLIKGRSTSSSIGRPPSWRPDPLVFAPRPPLRSDAATTRCPDAGGSRDRRRRRGRSDRGSCTDPPAGTRRRRVRP